MDTHLNSAQATASQYEVSVVEYGEPCVGSLLALVRDSGREQHSEQSSMIVPTIPSSFYNNRNHESCLVSAVPILQSSLCQGEIKLESHTAGGHFLIDDDDDDQQHFVLRAQTIASDIVKSEVFSNLAEQHEFGRKETSLMLGAPLESSFTPQPRAQMLISLQEPEVHRPGPANSFNEDDTKASIVAHPHYPRLVAAYMECQKVGAPPEVVARLDGLSQQYQLAPQHPLTLRIGLNPELDQFMEAYCEILIKFRDELRKPLNESLAFFKKIETQLNILSKETIRVSVPGEKKVEEAGESSEDEDGMSGVEADMIQHHHQQSEIDRELKERLLRKYSGYLSSLKQEFLKKKKKGKLPKEARQKLLEWWNVHYKWPYPSEAEKVGLAECTGLDQKQINNWFINQRKRHWKPSEDMQFVLMDCPNAQNAAFYVSGHLNSDVPVFPLGR